MMDKYGKCTYIPKERRKKERKKDLAQILGPVSKSKVPGQVIIPIFNFVVSTLPTVKCQVGILKQATTATFHVYQS
jgi:hypothetical protein